MTTTAISDQLNPIIICGSYIIWISDENKANGLYDNNNSQYVNDAAITVQLRDGSTILKTVTCDYVDLTNGVYKGLLTKTDTANLENRYYQLWYFMDGDELLEVVDVLAARRMED